MNNEKLRIKSEEQEKVKSEEERIQKSGDRIQKESKEERVCPKGKTLP